MQIVRAGFGILQGYIAEVDRALAGAVAAVDGVQPSALLPQQSLELVIDCVQHLAGDVAGAHAALRADNDQRVSGLTQSSQGRGCAREQFHFLGAGGVGRQRVDGAVSIQKHHRAPGCRGAVEQRGLRQFHSVGVDLVDAVGVWKFGEGRPHGEAAVVNAR